ncbi:hypothetical protein [Rhodobacter sp. NSM]|uniref:hypothetical protein n=1 Tax=Rhodobacter sp. NSM TaxID=3457501 RepID=UPI003FD62AA4
MVVIVGPFERGATDDPQDFLAGTVEHDKNALGFGSQHFHFYPLGLPDADAAHAARDAALHQ